MKSFRYFMPADVYFGRGCVMENKAAFSQLGKKAMLVTGRNSAKKNGAQKDVEAALEEIGIQWELFDEIGENPDVETVERAAKMAIAKKVEFFIGIGGGSPMDAAKAIAVLAANPEASTEILFADGGAKSLPVAEIPTTAGTGSEVTQFSILTLHKKRTKAAIAQKIFAKVSFLDPKYMDVLSESITNNTAVDALSHLIESYLSVGANFLSERISEMGFAVFRECMPALKSRVYTEETRDGLMLASMLGGIAIAQSGTSIPHCLGYFLTYEKQIPHGRANGMVTQAYLEHFPKDEEKVGKMLCCLDMESTVELGGFFKEVLDITETFTADEIAYYTERALETPQKLATFPYPISKEDIYRIYEKSLLK